MSTTALVSLALDVEQFRRSFDQARRGVDDVVAKSLPVVSADLALDGLLSFWSTVSSVGGDAILGAVERVLAAVESLLSGVGMSAAPVTSARVAIAEAREARATAKRAAVVVDVEPLRRATSDLFRGESTFLGETIDVGRERRLAARRTILSKRDQAQAQDAARRRLVVEEREEAATRREEEQAPRKVVVRSSEPCRVAFVRRLG